MSEGQTRLADRAAALKEAFDRSFAEPPRAAAAGREGLLAIQVGLEAYAIRLAEIAGIFADRKITRLSGRAAGLLGIAGFRRAILPVYDLRLLLGHPATVTPRWFVVSAGTPAAFAFDAFDGHLQVSGDGILPQEAGQAARHHVRDFVRAGEAVRPIVSLPSVLDSIRQQTGDGAPSRSDR